MIKQNTHLIISNIWKGLYLFIMKKIFNVSGFCKDALCIFLIIKCTPYLIIDRREKLIRLRSTEPGSRPTPTHAMCLNY